MYKTGLSLAVPELEGVIGVYAPTGLNCQQKGRCKVIIKVKQDWVALMSKPIALSQKKLISLVRLKLISSLG